MAKSFGNWFYSIKSEYRVILLGNLFLLVLFFSLFFLFFNGNIDWPLGVLTAIPFANLNYFLFIKSVDGVLATKSKGIFRIDFFVQIYYSFNSNCLIFNFMVLFNKSYKPYSDRYFLYSL